MALFLRDGEVNQAVNMDEMLVAIEEMQRHYGHGEVMNLGRRKIVAPGGLLSVMGGGLFYDGILGVKTYTVVQGKYSFQVSIYNADTRRVDVLHPGQPPGPASHRRHYRRGRQAPVQPRRGHSGHHRNRLPGPHPSWRR